MSASVAGVLVGLLVWATLMRWWGRRRLRAARRRLLERERNGTAAS